MSPGIGLQPEAGPGKLSGGSQTLTSLLEVLAGTSNVQAESGGSPQEQRGETLSLWLGSNCMRVGETPQAREGAWKAGEPLGCPNTHACSPAASHRERLALSHTERRCSPGLCCVPLTPRSTLKRAPSPNPVAVEHWEDFTTKGHGIFRVRRCHPAHAQEEGHRGR